ncbi:MAG: M48 family metallopeptidase [Treponema sp.]|nr:M48 family metallopeptidase [Treponema sp.]
MFSYTLIRSRRTTVQISILPDRTIVVRAPQFVPRQKIDEIVASKDKWIQKKISTPPVSALPLHHACVPGETIMYLGKPYILRIAAADEKPAGGRRIQVCVDGNHLVVFSRNRAVSDVQRTVETWLRNQALTVCTEIFAVCWERFSGRYPRAVHPELHLRTMKTRWGSLSQQTVRHAGLLRAVLPGRAVTRPPHMTLNTLLVCAEPYCIKQVIYHELCHIVHPDHSRAFYETLASFVPDWKETQKRLEETFRMV